jgi:peptidoglycan/LPS O-acetylase OafA/YrhL
LAVATAPRDARGTSGYAGRYALMDGLRGLAAIAVLIYHIGAVTMRPALAPFGYLAVDLFFMMSGFIIAKTYEQKLATAALSWGRFVAIRVTRLYPVLALGVLLAALLGAATKPAGVSVSSVLRSLTLTPNFESDELFFRSTRCFGLCSTRFC